VVGGAVVLGVAGAAAGAVKLSQQDVERIEEHTGDREYAAGRAGPGGA
jgi:hypothetical protein